ncbi:hypothetical protein AB0K40_40295 [Nonomuraea bangladeshensis]|uniref:Uncharacterized protein n=1 Tax=Nonomuraea bangladeshensis TaxID=404385 RepID=A0ABV3HH38_9ACTN
MNGDGLSGRLLGAGGAFIVNVGLLLAAGSAILWVRNRGVLCDGASRLCSGGDPTPEQWDAEMAVRSAVAYGSYALVALALVVIAVVAWRRRRHGVVVMQGVALAVVAVLVVTWEPYVSLH